MKTQTLNDRRYLGSLCIRKHGFKHTKKSLRYKSTGNCCVCSAMQMDGRKVEQKLYRDQPKNKKKAKRYGKIYRREKKKCI